MKKFLISMIMGISVLLVEPAIAAQLPPEVKNYVMQQSPDATIRFDGLITLPDGTLYLPLFPSYTVKNTELTVKTTYPENKVLSKKPDIIIFNNNYVLLKLIKAKDKSLSVVDLKEFPLEVRTGILPQDLLVPKGLVLPDSLVGILGDLNIPLTSNLKITSKQQIPQDFTQKEDLPKTPQKVNVIPQLKNKQFFMTNFNSNYIYIMPSEFRDVQYTLKLDSIPKAVKEVYGHYLLVTTNGKTYIDVVDIKNEEIAKQIDIGAVPDEMIITKDEKTAYLVSHSNSYIYVIDIPSMNFTKQIQVKGLPEKLALSEDEKKLVYQDSLTSDVYSVELKNNYVNIYQCNVPNASKLAILGNKVYVLSRTRNSLRIFPYQEFVSEKTAKDVKVLGSQKSFFVRSAVFAKGSAVKTQKKLEKEALDALNYVELGETIALSMKPVDMIYYKEKYYILSAINNSIDVFNPQTNVVEKNISLNVVGFSSKFNPIKNSNLVVVTNAVENKYVVFDIEKQLVLQINPIDVQMTTLTVIDKTKLGNTMQKQSQTTKPAPNTEKL